MDELFEALTLVQTRKVTSFPVVLMGTEFWGGLLDWIKSTLVGTGKISPADVDLIQVTDDVDEAVRIITKADQNRGERLRDEERAALNTVGDAQ
jgi:predicted Rossmann-fold nucleotide-binding protein